MTLSSRSYRARTLRVWAALAVVGASALPAWAQEEQPSRPFRSLFAALDPSVRPVLSISASLFGGYDNDLAAEQTGGVVPGADQRADGVFSGLKLTGAFARSRQTLELSASGVSMLRYYKGLDDLTSAGYSGNGMARLRLGSRSWLSARAGAGYTPYYAFSAEPEPVDPLTGVPARYRPYASSSRRLATYNAGLSFERTLTDRSSFGIGQDLRYADSLGEPTDTRDVALAANFMHRYQRAGSVRASYLFYSSTFFGPDAPEPTRLHTLQVDFSHNLVHSRTRRTALTFGIGPSILDQRGNRRQGIAGSAGVSRQIGRTWTAIGAYRYGYNFVEGLPDPVQSHSTNATLSGLLGRRVDVTIGGSVVIGGEGLGVASTSYDTYAGSARLGVALSRTAAIYCEYLFHRVSFGAGVELPQAYVREQDRHGVRVGLTVFLPVLNEKGSNAPR